MVPRQAGRQGTSEKKFPNLTVQVNKETRRVIPDRRWGSQKRSLARLGAVRLGQRADEDVLCAVDLPGDDGGAEGVDGALGARALAVLQDDHFGHVVGGLRRVRLLKG